VSHVLARIRPADEPSGANANWEGEQLSNNLCRKSRLERGVAGSNRGTALTISDFH
jgi:hypothetical protein